jgi:hypothetical protein
MCDLCATGCTRAKEGCGGGDVEAAHGHTKEGGEVAALAQHHHLGLHWERRLGGKGPAF